jgi:hypothetical protein
MTDVVFHAEDLLDYLDFSLDFVCNKITDVPPTKLRFAVLGPVEIHREFMTAAARWMFAAKL